MALLAQISTISGQELGIEDVRVILEQCDPVVVLIDMDCFYVQVEQLEKPETRGTPCAVMQFTDTGNGSIIALSYEAKACGVGRFTHAKEAKEICPEIHLFVVPSRYQKADIGRYRAAGNRVVEVIQSHFSLVSKASVDESYVDVSTEANKFILDALSADNKNEVNDDGFFIKPSMFASTEIYGVDVESGQRSVDSWIKSCFERLLKCPEDGRTWNDLLQLAGGVLIERLRVDILAKLEFHCSAGIAGSKTLAKLCCGINKPRRQTILPASQLKYLLATTSLGKIRSYGGKYGHEVQEKLHIQNVGDLLRFSREQLIAALGEKNGIALFRFANYGLDGEEVKVHDMAKSIGSSKNFPGANCIKTLVDLQKWVMAFSEELNDRVDRDANETSRSPTLLTVHLRYYKLSELPSPVMATLLKGGKISGRDYYLLTNHSMSRCTPLNGDWSQAKIYDQAMKIILKNFPCYTTERLYAGNGEPGRNLPKNVKDVNMKDEDDASVEQAGGQLLNQSTSAEVEKFPCPSCDRLFHSEQAIKQHVTFCNQETPSANQNNSLLPKPPSAAQRNIPSTHSTIDAAATKELVFVSFVMLCASKMESRSDAAAGIRQFLVKREKSPEKSMCDVEITSHIPSASRKKPKITIFDTFFSKPTEKPLKAVSSEDAMPIVCVTLSDSSDEDVADSADKIPHGAAAEPLKTLHSDEMLHRKAIFSAVTRNNSTSLSTTPTRAARHSTLTNGKKPRGKLKPDGNSRIDKFLRKVSKSDRQPQESEDDEVVVLDD